jgi:hypothetical protein
VEVVGSVEHDSLPTVLSQKNRRNYQLLNFKLKTPQTASQGSDGVMEQNGYLVQVLLLLPDPGGSNTIPTLKLPTAISSLFLYSPRTASSIHMFVRFVSIQNANRTVRISPFL